MLMDTSLTDAVKKMTDKPILFSAPMVRAVIDRNKKQTRRVLNPQPNMLSGGRPMSDGRGRYSTADGWRKPHFARHDRLYVRETWAHYQVSSNGDTSDGLVGYRADGNATIDSFREHVQAMFECDSDGVFINGDRWRPSLHMPRWASRLTLVVTDVRFQRLRDISDEDALAEGVVESIVGGKPWFHVPGLDDPGCGTSASDMFLVLWEHINGRGSVDANPWVAVYTFDTVHKNIDDISWKASQISHERATA